MEQLLDAEPIVVHAQRDDPVFCDAKREHEAPAEWWFEHSCGMPTYACTRHRDYFNAHVMRCQQCGALAPRTPAWSPI